VTWTSGYVRLDDRIAAPHSVMRRLPAFVVQDVARTIRARVDEQLSQSGLSWVSFSLLLVASEVDGLSQQTLALKAGVDRTRASAVLDDLEYEGYVTRRRCRDDARRIVVSVTGEGRHVVAEGLAAVERGELAAMRGLRRRERERVHALLVRLVRDDTPAFFKRFR
jgi:DNA-binding MarR family transcriptional regulator